MADTEWTNWREGISAIWDDADGDALGKGVNYHEEYLYHNQKECHWKVIYLRDDCPIRFEHNERNCGVTAASGRNRVVLGTNGPDNIPNSGDEGLIRFQADKIWLTSKRWSNAWGSTTTDKYPAYTGAFTLSSLEYEPGIPVVGTLGGRPGYNMGDSGFYWRGIQDSVGDEFHIIRVGDDDQIAGNNYDDSWASDGQHYVVCVNPKTPVLRLRASGGAQFYTTPKWTYWTHRVHDQTTYIQPGTGTLTVEIRNIYGGNISYRINGGATVNVGAAVTTLQSTAFNDGSNTLEYWYTDTPAVVRTRVVVKNPTHPGIPEGHGNRLWGASRWTAFLSKITRAPFSQLWTAALRRDTSLNTNDQIAWDTNIHDQGKRTGCTTVWPIKSGTPDLNAILAKRLGFTAVGSGAPRSYAAYAKAMLLQGPLANSPTGHETTAWASMAMPNCDTNNRGYWDVNIVFSSAIAYDILMGGYRSDQVAGGITPIEDYYIRDLLASWVHISQFNLSANDQGMWSSCRAVGALAVACVMPSYSTPYYGTSGVDGNTTTYPDTPWRVYNPTWVSSFLRRDHEVGAFGNYPTSRWNFVEGMTSVYQTHLVGPPTLPVEDGQVRCWRNRTPYVSWSQCGHNLAWYALLWKLYSPTTPHPDLLNFIDQITAGTLYGRVWGTDGNPVRWPFIWCLQSDFPQAATNAAAWMKTLPTTDSRSESAHIYDTGILSAVFYDDQYYGGGQGGGNNQPQFTTVPSGSRLSVGAPLSLTVVVTGTPTPTLQWRHDGVAINGATSATLDLGTADLAEMGLYDCVATNSEGIAVTPAVLVEVINVLNTPRPLKARNRRRWKG